MSENSNIELLEQLDVVKIDALNYRSKHFLEKPHPMMRGVYGGGLCGQALAVAIRSCGPGLVPHSLHSYFVKAALPDRHIFWEVEIISETRNFSNMILKARQDDVIKFVAQVSLTTKNSMTKKKEEYAEYEKIKKARGNDDDDHDSGAGHNLTKPIGYGVPFPKWLKNTDPEKMVADHQLDKPSLLHQLPEEFVNMSLVTEEEENTPASERKMAYWVRWGDQVEQVLKRENVEKFKYAGLAYLSDSLFLNRMARVLRIDEEHRVYGQYFSLSLDHIIYFHDVDFDPSEWMAFSYKAVNMLNDRVLVEGEMFNKAGDHIASIVQEGYLKLEDHLADRAKF